VLDNLARRYTSGTRLITLRESGLIRGDVGILASYAVHWMVWRMSITWLGTGWGVDVSSGQVYRTNVCLLGVVGCCCRKRDAMRVVWRLRAVYGGKYLCAWCATREVAIRNACVGVIGQCAVELSRIGD
jgi:hypothetical protein